MKSFFTLFQQDIKRAVISPLFLFSLLGMLAVLYTAGYPHIFMWYAELSDVNYILESSMFSTGTDTMLIQFLPLLPYATVWVKEYNENASSFWIIRTGVSKYVVSKYLAVLLSGMLAFILGILLFILPLSFHFPLYNEATIGGGDTYEIFLHNGQPFLYFLFFLLHYGLSAALFAGTCMWVSTLIPNRFAAFAGPAVLYLLLLRVTETLPPYLQAGMLLDAAYSTGNPITTLLFKAAWTVGLCLLMGAASVSMAKRRVQNG